jgi:LysR family hydrogen peroxide-inducible transcriptional activator
LFEEDLLLALPTKHRLMKKRQIGVDDLNGEPFILLSEMHCLGQQILDFCNRKSCRPFVTCHSSQVLTVQELVSIGHGVSLLPAMACALDRHPGRRYRRLSGECPTRALALVWHKQRYQRPIVRQFIEFMKSHAPEPNSAHCQTTKASKTTTKHTKNTNKIQFKNRTREFV